ncbi:hypothetical protein DOY81_008349, partial [Sarcophaga bullata]
NGRHACSSLCPKEQLPAPEDTISCRSPRLVEVPGHCCKMWLCENPTADVYATCHNSSTSPWTPCSRKCGIGISTRFTTTTAGCNQLSNLRLCENRKCETVPDNSRHKLQQQQQQPLAAVWHKENHHNIEEQKEQDAKITEEKQKYLMKTKQLKNKLKRRKQQQQQQQQQHHDKHQPVQQEFIEHEHRIRKGHECRSIQRLGPARIRLGQCVSKKLYRPKICGRCHENTKCCVPSVSTTIQVELLCPLNAMDPISYVQQQLTTAGQQREQQKQQQQQKQGQLYYSTSDTSASATPSITAAMSSTLTSLWDTHSLDAIDQEYLQSHQIQIENKFIAVEWILKCECTNN